MIDADAKLSEIILADAPLRLVEPGIYSVYTPGGPAGAYDRFGAATVYDVIACSRLYNRLMWGYLTADYVAICKNVLAASPEGWVLDIACGSLAFTAEFYADFSSRPVLLLDQSLNLLRKGKSRLVKRRGRLPANMVFLQADALQLPFKPESFSSIISLNLLHCLEDVKTALGELKRVLTAAGSAALTTLVLSGSRWSDGYLRMLAESGALVQRNIDELLAVFDGLDMPVRHQVKGNLAFITYR
ncbi:MAG: methyltransferase domain-containing protein [Thermodesulfobacteriota bacterium]